MGRRRDHEPRRSRGRSTGNCVRSDAPGRSTSKHHAAVPNGLIPLQSRRHSTKGVVTMSRAGVRSRVALVLVLFLSLIFVAGNDGLAQEAGEIQVAVTPVSLGPAIPPEFDLFKNDWPAPGG